MAERVKLVIDLTTKEESYVPLTAEELALAEADEQLAVEEAQREAARQAERDQLRAVYVALRDGTGTAGERLVRLEKVVAWLMRREALGD